MNKHLVLAWDTATPWCSLALARLGTDEVEVLGQYQSQDGPSHSQILPPLVAQVLKEAGLTVKDLDFLAVGQGPGSFTGVRTGLSLAKGLALGANLPLYAFPTPDILAAPFLDNLAAGDHLVCVIDARHQEIFAKFYSSNLSRHQKIETFTTDDLWHKISELSGSIKIIGPDTDLLGDPPPNLQKKINRASTGPDPLALAQMAYQQAIVAGQKASPVLPLYLRQPDIRCSK